MEGILIFICFLLGSIMASSFIIIFHVSSLYREVRKLREYIEFLRDRGFDK